MGQPSEGFYALRVLTSVGSIIAYFVDGVNIDFSLHHGNRLRKKEMTRKQKYGIINKKRGDMPCQAEL